MEENNFRFGNPLLLVEPKEGEVLATAAGEPLEIFATREQKPQGRERFEPLPKPTGKPPFRLQLSSIIGKEAETAIRNAGRLVFHSGGDSGGVKDGTPQAIVAKKLVEQLTDRRLPPVSFFYHLGDVVYFFGETREYYGQFYEPYENYTRPFFAIPGNHDGMPASGESSLEAYMRNFCNKRPIITPEAGDVDRSAMIQPNCYFTLVAPFVTIVGLYSNVPSGGRIENDQLDWLIGELKAADKNAALILAVHHPIYSADTHHSGSVDLENRIHSAFDKAGRVPDAVLTGHVHNFQRFTRVFGKKEVPYIVAGAVGYHNLHSMQKGRDGRDLPVPFKIKNNPRLVLENYLDNRFGFLRITATEQELLLDYFSTPRPQESWSRPAQRYDTCRLQWRAGKIVPS